MLSTTNANAGHGGEVATMSVGDGDLAIDGYDPVAYFTEQAATRDSVEFSYSWSDAVVVLVILERQVVD